MDLLKLYYSNIPTINKAKDDYEKLRSLKVDKNIHSIIGNRATDKFFFRERAKTKIKNRKSHHDFLKDKSNYDKVKNIIKALKYDEINKRSVSSAVRMNLGSVNQFRPSTAKYIYSLFNPNTILDFSSGWGGRCLAAMSLDKNYIGFDTNNKLKKPYNDLINTYDTKGKIRIIFQDSSKVDFSKYKYDMIFTSPPYYDLEIYTNMRKYDTFNDFNDTFYHPVVSNSFKYLSKDGWCCLNIPKDLYNETKKILGKENKRLKYLINNRFNDGKQRYEYIYCWKK